MEKIKEQAKNYQIIIKKKVKTKKKEKRIQINRKKKEKKLNEKKNKILKINGRQIK